MSDHDARMGLMLAVMESALQNFDAGGRQSIERLDGVEGAEVAETIEEGLENFIEASVDVSPFQKLMVGTRYCLAAIDDWKRQGPLGEGQ